MTTTDEVPSEFVRSYDHLHCPIGADPYDILESYRDLGTGWSPDHGGFWLVTALRLPQRSCISRTCSRPGRRSRRCRTWI